MKKALEFLQLGGATCKDIFLQHITELVQIKIKPDATFVTLFDDVREYFKDNPDGLEAAEDWVRVNQEEREKNPEPFEKRILTDIAIKTGKDFYAIFNLFNDE